MSELGSQRDYWNVTAASFDTLEPPLRPSQQDLAFMQTHIVPDGTTLILGVTPELCTLAATMSKTTAVDFSQPMIDAQRIEGAQYACDDWIHFLEQSTDMFDTIITDAGLTCLQFPDDWDHIAKLVRDHLKPGGIFAARTFMSTDTPPNDDPASPSLRRFISSMSNATSASNWMMRPQHPAYVSYDVNYAFPPEAEIRRIWEGCGLVPANMLVPSYEEGEHFVSFAWQQPGA